MTSTIARGVALAALAAVAFGVTTPIVAWAGRGLGPFETAALLYAGAAVIAVVARGAGPRLRRSDAPRLLAIAVAGAALAPTLLAWGLQRAGATVGALLLNLEAVFTVLLARALYHEPIGARVALAVAAMVAGGAALVLDASRSLAVGGVLGVLAVAGATACWALDNVWTRPLAEREPFAVVAAKASLGALLTIAASFIARESTPRLGPALALVACGATGYGLSLRFYLLAQRAIGAGRTGSVFAVAPFVGAALAVALGDRALGPLTLCAAALFVTGVALHATERHDHRHMHGAIHHDHMHRHDDGHHGHLHDPPFVGEHSHPHHHDAVEHDHEHAPDLHHDHH